MNFYDEVDYAEIAAQKAAAREEEEYVAEKLEEQDTEAAREVLPLVGHYSPRHIKSFATRKVNGARKMYQRAKASNSEHAAMYEASLAAWLDVRRVLAVLGR